MTPAEPAVDTETLWWQRGIIYQVYARSFQDSNGDGVGDLTGIRQRLDYLVWLGINAVWISPFYPSPMADFGYDVADYCDVDPLFGSLADFDALVARRARARTESRSWISCRTIPRSSHPWFLESRASRDNPKRDWFIWRDGKPDGKRTVGRPTTGSRSSAVRPGPEMRRPVSGICTVFCASSRT